MIGLAGVAQVLRIDRTIQSVRRGRVIKQTKETALAATSLWPEERSPEALLQLVRSHWAIENGQHHRRDRTQDEDRCTVGDTIAARNLSLFRSLAIFLFELQRPKKEAQKSLPDFERHHLRRPGALILRFMSD